MRQHLVNLALKLVGTPYIWGGSSPRVGFDCSGFVVWIYQVFGLLPSGDWTAQGVYEHFKPAPNTLMPAPGPGDIVFYGKNRREITHVMLSVGGGLVVGASGGGSDCVSVEVAHRRGAMVKVKPQDYRSDWVCTLTVLPEEK